MLPQVDHDRWFAEEVRPHESALRAYLCGRFPTLPDLDDLVQETYARVFKARVKGTVEVARPYLFATARNAALDHFRRRHIVWGEAFWENTIPDMMEDTPDAAELASYNQEVDLLYEAIAGLPGRCRQVLVLCRLKGHPHEVIARLMGISVKTVDAHLRAALFRCRAFLLAHGVSRGAPAGDCGTKDMIGGASS